MKRIRDRARLCLDSNRKYCSCDNLACPCGTSDASRHRTSALRTDSDESWGPAPAAFDHSTRGLSQIGPSQSAFSRHAESRVIFGGTTDRTTIPGIVESAAGLLPSALVGRLLDVVQPSSTASRGTLAGLHRLGRLDHGSRPQTTHSSPISTMAPAYGCSPTAPSEISFQFLHHHFSTLVGTSPSTFRMDCRVSRDHPSSAFQISMRPRYWASDRYQLLPA